MPVVREPLNPNGFTPLPKNAVIELEVGQLESLISNAVYKGIRLANEEKTLKTYNTKSEMAKAIGKSRNTINAMITRNEIEITKDKKYKLKY